MHLIRTCAKCGKRIRFPIDRGVIRVKCPCGESFTADPDDTRLYENADFDLSSGTKGKKAELSGNPAGLFDPLRFKAYRELLIRRLFDAKYKLQNFRLLPWKEQRWVLLRGLAVLIVFLVLFYLVCLKPGSE
jgi:hypothetical protein